MSVLPQSCLEEQQTGSAAFGYFAIFRLVKEMSFVLVPLSVTLMTSSSLLQDLKLVQTPPKE